MPLLLPVLLLMGATTLEPDGASKTDLCPPDHPSADRMIRMFLGNPLLPELSVHSRIGTANLEDVRLLTSEHDREICEALWTSVRGNGTDLVPSDQIAFYRSGDRFFVPINRSRRNARPGAFLLDGPSSLDVYDSEYRLIDRFRA